MTLYTAIQMIESGTTTVMYNHPQTPISGLEDDVAEILQAFADAGMQTAFSVYFRERNRVVYADDQEFGSGLPSDLAASRLSRCHLSSDAPELRVAVLPFWRRPNYIGVEVVNTATTDPASTGGQALAFLW